MARTATRKMIAAGATMATTASTVEETVSWTMGKEMSRSRSEKARSFGAA